MKNNNVKLDMCNLNFFSILTIVFIILKLTDVINWSWWWVLSPLWLPVIIVLASVFIFIILLLIFGH